MMSSHTKLTVIRALSASIAHRALTLYVIIDSIILVLTFAGMWLLAHFLSSWFWLLLIIYIPFAIVSVGIYIIARFIASRLYRARLTPEQRQHLKDYTDKITRLLETRGMSWPWFAMLCVRDLLVYRELRTFKELFSDASSLKTDFTDLEHELS